MRDGGGQLRRAGTMCAARHQCDLCRHQWAREAGELPWVSRHSVGRETGVTIIEFGVVKLEHWKVKSRDFEPEETFRSLETS